MRLKNLQIMGFKSFADKISIDFDGEVIGVIGPNGCGKSNIVDAFRWVMGEQSAKSLRGGRMQDVLFAGTDTRKAFGMAEVSVTLTDVGEKLPVPYDEVTITRRLYRSGESEYQINRQTVRLKDVQDLFLGSGIGKNTFSIFEQGKLDQVMHLGPLERRGIFDEAAGIGRFIQRKKETTRKLAQVSINHDRLRAIHGEVEKQTKQLKKQASHAEHFQASKAHLLDLERKLLITRWRTISEKNRDVETALLALVQETEEKKHRMSALEEHLEVIKEELKNKQAALKTEANRFHQAETKCCVLESELSEKKQQLSALEKKIPLLEIERVATRAKHEQLVKEIEILKKEEGSAAFEDKAKFEQYLIEKKRDYDACQVEMDCKQIDLKRARETHLKAIQAYNLLHQKLQEKKMQLQTDEQRLEGLEKHIYKKKQQFIDLTKERKKKEGIVKTFSEKIDELKLECEFSEKAFFESQEDAKKKRALLQVSLDCVTQLSAREAALEQLKQAYEGFSSGAKSLLEQSSLKGKVRPLFEVLAPKKEMMPALQRYAQTVAVSSKQHLDQLLAFAQQEKLTDFSVVIFDKQTFLKHLSVSQDIKAALQLACETVTKEGFYVDQNGVVFHTNSSIKEGNPFLREAELISLKKMILKEKKKQGLLEKALKKAQDLQKTCEEKRRLSIDKRRKLDMQLLQENFTLQRAISDLESLTQELKEIKKEERALLDAIEKQTSKILPDFQEKLDVRNRECLSLEQTFKEDEKRVEKQNSTVQIALQQWQEMHALHQKALTKWQQCEKQQALLQSNETQCVELLEKQDKEKREVKGCILELNHLLANKSSEHALQIEDLKKQRLIVEEQEKELKNILAKREVLDKTLRDKREELSILEKKQHRLEITCAEDLSWKKGIEQELYEKYQLNPEHVEEILDLAIEDTEKQIRELKVFLDRASTVNMTAIEEYKIQEKRFKELDHQLFDLEESKRDLEKIIGKLDKESRKIFKETFEHIRRHFKKNFSILFNGGEADLLFTGSVDPLEAGIEIKAKPPGKQMRSISLLSGGEKCLTALALLFSMFEVRPAPFCILDEVDAPLDDSNIERFTNILKQYIEDTQFILVTHNKKTMAIADLLLGISMEEKGVSKMLSLAFEKSTVSA